MDETQYLIWSIKHNLWWGKDGERYADKAAEARKYTLKDAKKIVNNVNDWEMVDVCMIPANYYKMGESC